MSLNRCDERLVDRNAINTVQIHNGVVFKFAGLGLLLFGVAVLVCGLGVLLCCGAGFFYPAIAGIVFGLILFSLGLTMTILGYKRELIYKKERQSIQGLIDFRKDLQKMEVDFLKIETILSEFNEIASESLKNDLASGFREIVDELNESLKKIIDSIDINRPEAITDKEEHFCNLKEELKKIRTSLFEAFNLIEINLFFVKDENSLRNMCNERGFPGEDVEQFVNILNPLHQQCIDFTLNLFDKFPQEKVPRSEEKILDLGLKLAEKMIEARKLLKTMDCFVKGEGNFFPDRFEEVFNDLTLLENNLEEYTVDVELHNFVNFFNLFEVNLHRLCIENLSFLSEQDDVLRPSFLIPCSFVEQSGFLKLIEDSRILIKKYLSSVEEQVHLNLQIREEKSKILSLTRFLNEMKILAELQDEDEIVLTVSMTLEGLEREREVIEGQLKKITPWLGFVVIGNKILIDLPEGREKQRLIEKLAVNLDRIAKVFSLEFLDKTSYTEASVMLRTETLFDEMVRIQEEVIFLKRLIALFIDFKSKCDRIFQNSEALMEKKEAVLNLINEFDASMQGDLDRVKMSSNETAREQIEQQTVAIQENMEALKNGLRSFTKLERYVLDSCLDSFLKRQVFLEDPSNELQQELNVDGDFCLEALEHWSAEERELFKLIDYPEFEATQKWLKKIAAYYDYVFALRENIGKRIRVLMHMYCFSDKERSWNGLRGYRIQRPEPKDTEERMAVGYALLAETSDILAGLNMIGCSNLRQEWSSKAVALSGKLEICKMFVAMVQESFLEFGN